MVFEVWLKFGFLLFFEKWDLEKNCRIESWNLILWIFGRFW